MPRTPRTLTFREVNAIKKQGYTALGGAVGLYLFVHPTGSRYYYYRYKAIDGKRSAICLGSFSSMDLAQARKLALEWKERLAKGENPSIVRKEQAEAAKREREQRRIEEQKSKNTFAYVGYSDFVVDLSVFKPTTF